MQWKRYLSAFITLKQYGMGYFVEREPNEEDRRIASEGLREIKEIMCSEKYDLIILDEANIAVYYKLFSAEDLLDFIDAKPENVEIIITGRHADPKIIDRADLVTEMKEIKHYYHQEVEARRGIEKCRAFPLNNTIPNIERDQIETETPKRGFVPLNRPLCSRRKDRQDLSFRIGTDDSIN